MSKDIFTLEDMIKNLTDFVEKNPDSKDKQIVLRTTSDYGLLRDVIWLKDFNVHFNHEDSDYNSVTIN